MTLRLQCHSYGLDYCIRGIICGMKILVVGSGGREHAITWRLAQDAEKHELWCAPGNAGMAEMAVCVPVKATDVAGIVAWC